MVHKHRMDVNAKWNWKRNKTIETLSCLANDNHNNFDSVHTTISTRCMALALVLAHVQRVVRNARFVAHAKTNHFTFTLIIAVAFALAVHYSYFVSLGPPRSFFFATIIWPYCECQKKQIISLYKYDVDMVVPMWLCLCLCRVLTDSFFSERRSLSVIVILFSFAISFRSVDDPYFAR